MRSVLIVFFFICNVEGSEVNDVLDTFLEESAPQGFEAFVDQLYTDSKNPTSSMLKDVALDPLVEETNVCPSTMNDPFDLDFFGIDPLVTSYLTSCDMAPLITDMPDDSQCVPSMDVAEKPVYDEVLEEICCGTQGTIQQEVPKPLNKKKKRSRLYGHITKDPYQKKILEEIYKANPDITPEELSQVLTDHKIILNEFAAKNYLKKRSYGSGAYKHITTNEDDNAILESICEANPDIKPEELSRRLFHQGIKLPPIAAGNYLYNKRRRAKTSKCVKPANGYTPILPHIPLERKRFRDELPDGLVGSPHIKRFRID